MKTTTIRVREPRELLALLPYQLGFQPRDSAVVVSLRPPRGRVGLIARVDLPDLAEPDLGPALARRLVTHLVGDGADRAVLVLYTVEDPRPWVRASPGGPRVPRPAGGPAGQIADARVAGGPGGGGAHRAVRHLQDAAAAFLADVAAWVVTPTGYLALDCDDARCCPVGGRPVRELQATQVGAHMVLAGAMVADSRESLVPDRPAPARARRNAARAAERSDARRARAEADGAQATARWRSQMLACWRSQLAAARRGDAPAAAALLGRLASGLGDVAVRDAVLLTLVPGASDVAERSLGAPAVGGATVDPRGEAERVVGDALAAIVSPEAGVPPEADTLAAATALLHDVVDHAGGGRRAPALTLLGLLAWWRGDGARAGVLLDRALRADPGHRLAHLLSEAVEAGLAPGWVRSDRRPDGDPAVVAGEGPGA